VCYLIVDLGVVLSELVNHFAIKIRDKVSQVAVEPVQGADTACESGDENVLPAPTVQRIKVQPADQNVSVDELQKLVVAFVADQHIVAVVS